MQFILIYQCVAKVSAIKLKIIANPQKFLNYVILIFSTKILQIFDLKKVKQRLSFYVFFCFLKLKNSDTVLMKKKIETNSGMNEIKPLFLLPRKLNNFYVKCFPRI